MSGYTYSHIADDQLRHKLEEWTASLDELPGCWYDQYAAADGHVVMDALVFGREFSFDVTLRDDPWRCFFAALDEHEPEFARRYRGWAVGGELF